MYGNYKKKFIITVEINSVRVIGYKIQLKCSLQINIEQLVQLYSNLISASLIVNFIRETTDCDSLSLLSTGNTLRFPGMQNFL